MSLVIRQYIKENHREKPFYIDTGSNKFKRLITPADEARKQWKLLSIASGGEYLSIIAEYWKEIVINIT